MKVIVKRCIEKISQNNEGVCDNATPISSNCLECFQRQFFDGNDIGYKCDEKIYIYVARYFPVHVKEIIEALKLLPEEYFEKLFELKKINIMNIGGGPGSDSFAVKKFLIEKQSVGEIQGKKEIYMLRIDKENNWDGMAGFVNGRIKDTENIKYLSKKSNFDVCVKNQWALSDKKYNLFTLSYLLSEIDDEKIDTLSEFVNSYASDTVSGLIINDNNRPKVKNLKEILFHNILCNNPIEVEDSSRFHCGFFYEDEDRDLVNPKLSTNSIRYAKVIKL
jgi:hypothetical protein